MRRDQANQPTDPNGADRMSDRKRYSRREFVKWGGAAVAIGAGVGPFAVANVLRPVVATAAGPNTPPDLEFGGTDGWIWLPPDPPIGNFHPDNLAPEVAGIPLTTYVFGFHNITGLSESQRSNQKNQAQHTAPMFWTQVGQEFRVKLTNLGLAQRPDLFDAHTLHWHGFRNVIPFFDGEPSGSVAVPAGRDFTYVYRPNDAGTYMFHCHVEDTEHVQMGMTGIVFIRPQGYGTPTAIHPTGKYAYDETDGSTGYDREFALMLSEVWAEAHWADAHIQLPEWSDYRADFAMINGRTYPYTVAPHSPLTDLASAANWRYLHFDHDAAGDLKTNAGYEQLKYQPQSSLVTCKSGDKVLLRMSNLGYKQAAMTLAGIRMKVVGKDATLLNGRTGANTSYETDTVMLGAGESADVIFTAPSVGSETKFLLYNRAFSRSANLTEGGVAGSSQATEIRVFPTLAAQQFPNDYVVSL